MLRRMPCVAALAVCAGLIQAANAQSAITLRYGQNAAGAKGLSSLPLNVAIRKGYFVRQGIDLKVVNIKGGTDRIVAALDRGEIEAGKNATPYLIQAVLKGSDAVAVVSQTANPIYSLIVRPEIKSYADLKGKTIGLSTAGDTITLSTARLLAAKGLKPGDYQAKPVVGTPARFACLKSGDCAAVPMGQPDDLRAVTGGFPRLGYTYEAGADLVFNVDMVRRAWGVKNRDAVVRLVRAFASSYAYMNDPRNRDEIVRLIAELGGRPEPLAREIFAPYLDPAKNVLPRRGELDLAAVARVLTLMADSGVIPKSATAPERYVDLQYLKQAGVQ
jgi:ABC-type nitrate/sulfonate/bicarbonate transport system substrate-binding protein